MKKSLKVIALSLAAVCFAGVSAFAMHEYFSQMDGSYRDASNACITITLSSSKFQAKALADPQATIKDNLGTQHPIFLGTSCNTGTPAELIP